MPPEAWHQELALRKSPELPNQWPSGNPVSMGGHLPKGRAAGRWGRGSEGLRLALESPEEGPLLQLTEAGVGPSRCSRGSWNHSPDAGWLEGSERQLSLGLAG